MWKESKKDQWFVFLQGTATPSEKSDEDQQEKLVMPGEVVQVLYGGEQARWLREAVVAYREVSGSVPLLSKALRAAATENFSFSKALIAAVMVCMFFFLHEKNVWSFICYLFAP